MRAAFWTASDDGSSWYRATQPAAALGWLGHECVVDKELVPMHRRADVVVGSRVANVGPSELWAELAADPDGPRLVLDIDDDYFHIHPSNTRAYEFWNGPEVLNRLRRNMVLADAITVPSVGLAEVVAAELADWSGTRPFIHVVPNGLHAGYLGKPRDYDPDVITIGWAGSNSTAVDYDLCSHAVNKALDTFPNVRARLVGMPEELLPHRLKVEAARWVTPNEAYLEAVSSFDIWLAPYRSTPFNEAKFPTKALEAGMLGIPLVASDIRPYREWITQNEDGILVRHDFQFSRALKGLITSSSDRRRIGEAARSRAARNILQSVGQQWETVLFG